MSLKDKKNVRCYSRKSPEHTKASGLIFLEYQETGQAQNL